MPKPVIKKSVAPAPSKASAPAPTEKKTRTRSAVLVQVTASYLRDKIGADTKIGVSRKQLTAIITKANAVDVLGDLPA